MRADAPDFSRSRRFEKSASAPAIARGAARPHAALPAPMARRIPPRPSTRGARRSPNSAPWPGRAIGMHRRAKPSDGATPRLGSGGIAMRTGRKRCTRHARDCRRRNRRHRLEHIPFLRNRDVLQIHACPCRRTGGPRSEQPQSHDETCNERNRIDLLREHTKQRVSLEPLKSKAAACRLGNSKVLASARGRAVINLPARSDLPRPRDW